MTVEEITVELEELYERVGAPVDRHNPEALSQALVELVGWLARSGVLEADTKYYLTQAEGEAAEKVAHLDLPHNKLKAHLAVECVVEQRAVDLAHRLYSTCLAAIETNRSLLSYAKGQMRL